MTASLSGEEDFGPFTGWELGQALVCLEWRLRDVPWDSLDSAVYARDGFDDVILEWKWDEIYWGDPTFKRITKQMAGWTGLLGDLSRRAKRETEEALLAAVRRYRDKKRRGVL
jgi:hypothetical protein